MDELSTIGGVDELEPGPVGVPVFPPPPGCLAGHRVPEQHTVVVRNVREIRWDTTYLFPGNIFAHLPTGRVFVDKDRRGQFVFEAMSDPAKWAGVLAHEANHLEMYNTCQVIYEKDAMTTELHVLRILGVDPSWIALRESVAAGVASWGPYHNEPKEGCP